MAVGLGGANLAANIGFIVAEMDKRGVCKAFPISRQELATQLTMQANTVNRFRAL